jgi:hypothetical protein
MRRSTRSPRHALFLATALLSLATPLAAQVAPGDRVRVSTGRASRFGTLVATPPDSVVFTVKDRRYAYHWTDISRFERSLGRETFKARGALTGGIVGGVLGLLVGLSFDAREDREYREGCPTQGCLVSGRIGAGMATAVGAVGGAGLGALVGLAVGARGVERWSLVAIPGASVTLRAGPGLALHLPLVR